MNNRNWLETISCVSVLQIRNLSNFELTANAEQKAVTMPTEVEIFVLRGRRCCCKRNDVTPRLKAKRNNEALV